MDNRPLWIKNFFISKVGFNSMIPAMAGSVPKSQEIFFGNPSSHFPEHFTVMEHCNNTGSYFRDDDLARLADDVTETIYENPGKIEKLHKEAYKLNDEWFDFVEKFLKKDIKNLSDAELAAAFGKMKKLFVESHCRAVLTTWFVDSHGETFSKRLLKETEDYIKKSGQNISVADAFSILTTSPKNSFQLREELESLKIVKKIRDDMAAKKIIGSLADFSEIPKELTKDLQAAMRKHFEKWKWAPFEYIGPEYGIDHYLKEWKELAAKQFDVGKKIKELEGRPKKVSAERAVLMKKLKIPAKQKRIYNIAADIIFLKGYRKDVWYHGATAEARILKEMARRKNIPLDFIWFIYPEEIKEILLRGKKIDPLEIENRKRLAIFSYKDGKSSIITGEEAQIFLSSKNIKKEEINSAASEWKGTIACIGKATGKVRIVNQVEDVGKVEEGDIMVSHTTFPSLVPAMKLAAAIVTEDGGITCHAAIVSREMKKPCIVGIKSVTKVLKDGDLVEVDATRGVIRKI